MLAARRVWLQPQISFAVSAKQLDAQRLQGDAAVQLIEAAAQLMKEAGKGANVDSLA
ncbi:MAG: hypothetical protein ACYC3X_29620 [Pirellulaceae bacterium]